MIKQYRNSYNLFDKDNTTVGWTSSTGTTTADTFGAQFKFTLSGQTKITIKANATLPHSYSLCWYNDSDTFISRTHYATAAMGQANTANVPANAASCVFQVSCGSSPSDVMTQEMLNSYNLMLNSGKYAYPYESYNTIGWYTLGYRVYSSGAWGIIASDKKYSGGSWG